MPMPVTAADVERIIDGIIDPCSRISGTGLSLVEMGLVRSISVGGEGGVDVHVGLTGPGCYMGPALGEEIEARVKAMPGVTAVRVRMQTNLHYSEELLNARGRAKLAAARSDRISRLGALRRSMDQQSGLG